MYLVNREMEKISTQLTILVFARNSSTENPNAVWAQSSRPVQTNIARSCHKQTDKGAREGLGGISTFLAHIDGKAIWRSNQKSGVTLDSFLFLFLPLLFCPSLGPKSPYSDLFSAHIVSLSQDFCNSFRNSHPTPGSSPFSVFQNWKANGLTFLFGP